MDERHINLREGLSQAGYTIRYSEKNFPRGHSTFVKVSRPEGLSRMHLGEIIHQVLNAFPKATLMEEYRPGMHVVTFSVYEPYKG